MSDGDCRTGYLCESGACVRTPSRRDDADSEVSFRDVAAADTTSDDDTTGQGDPVDTGAESDSDAAADTASSDTVSSDVGADSVDPDTGSGICGGRAPGYLGERCGGADDCCNGLCLGDAEAGLGYCTEPCTTWAACNPVGFAGDFVCLDVGEASDLCVASDYQDPCDAPDDCIGQICLRGLGTAGCSYQCESGLQCPPGSACGNTPFDAGGGEVAWLWTCAPVGASCTVDPEWGLNDCLSGTCLEPDTGGPGYCSVFCDASDTAACPTGYTCEVVDEAAPAVCVRT